MARTGEVNPSAPGTRNEAGWAAPDAAEIIDLLARYAHVIDNRDWVEAGTVFTDDVQLGRSPAICTGIDELSAPDRYRARDPWSQHHRRHPRATC